MTDVKRLLFVYSNMGDGGTQRQRSILSKELRKNFDLTICLFDNIQLHKFYGRIIDLKAPTVKNPIKLIFNFLKRIFMVYKLTGKGGYNLLFSSSVIANSVCLLSKKLFRIKIPLIITFNNSLGKKTADMGIAGKVSRYINLKLSNKADLIIPNARKLEDELRELGFPGNKLTTVYNGIDFEDMQKKANLKIEDRFEYLYNDSSPVVISIGRLTRQKDYGTLIKSFKKVRESMTARLIILGEGEARQELEWIIYEHGLSNDVHLIGWVENPYNHLKRSDLFVLSSLWEGFPNVVIEALGLGVPVISTDCPTGPNEIIANGKNGILVPVNDCDSMAEAISSLLTDDSLREAIRIAGRERAENFNIKNISKQYEVLINGLIS